MSAAEPVEEQGTHLLLVANETVEEQELLEAVGRYGDNVHVTVVAPINQPRRGYVVYSDTRRASAHRRLDRALDKLRRAGVSAEGYIVDGDPAAAVRDALAQLEPPVDAILVSTHPEAKSGWLRRNVVERIRGAAGEIPVEHLVVQDRDRHEENVLVLANETVLGEQLLDTIRERARRSPSSFLIISPQTDPTMGAHPDAERRLKRALTQLRGEGIDVHGQVAHPDPFSAAMEAIHDERVDEIIVSTFEPLRSGWLRKDLVDRLRRETGVPVEHVVVPETAEVAS
jgi:GABA permease